MKFVPDIVKNKHSTGFTFVELLIIMILVGILAGAGVQYQLSTQEDKGRLTEARTFLINSFPMAALSCTLRNVGLELAKIGSVGGACEGASELTRENISEEGAWGDAWIGGAYRDSAGSTLTFYACYPLNAAGSSAANLGDSLKNYLEDKWGNNTDNEANFFASSPEFSSNTTSLTTGLGNALCAQSNVLVVEYPQI